MDMHTKILLALKAAIAYVSARARTPRSKKAVLNTLVVLVLALVWLGAQSSFENIQCRSLSSGMKLTPELALRFVQWWSQKSMDFEVATAVKNHKEAWGWMQVRAIRSLEASIWYPCLPRKVGNYSFLCTGFHAPLVKNPKTITVGLSGVLLSWSNCALPLRLITINFDVIEEPLGLRIADARIAGDPTGQYTANFLSDKPFNKHSFKLSSFIDRNIGRW